MMSSAMREGVRIDHARELLEATELAMKAVAIECGFDTPEQMRSAFSGGSA